MIEIFNLKLKIVILAIKKVNSNKQKKFLILLFSKKEDFCDKKNFI